MLNILYTCSCGVHTTVQHTDSARHDLLWPHQFSITETTRGDERPFIPCTCHNEMVQILTDLLPLTASLRKMQIKK
eukprot:4014418-Amphidinium_carterae.2